MKAAFFACKSVGLEPSVRNLTKASAAIRGLNGEARPVWAEHVRAWAAANIKNDTLAIQPRHDGDTAAPRKTGENDTPATHDRHPRAGVVKELELQDTTSPIGDGARTATASTTHKGAAKPLQFDLDNTVRSSEILALIWTRISATMGRSITKTQWGKQNRTTARDLASLGRTDDEIVRAFDSHTVKFGMPRTVKAVQTELGFLDAGPQQRKAPPRFDAGSPVQTIPKADRR